MKNKKNYLNAAMIYAAVILGAGFASGQEILSYFVNYGSSGFLGIGLSSIIFAFTGWAIWDICLKENIFTYKQFMDKVAGPSLAKIIEVVLGLFMFIVYAAMLAASGASLNEAFNLSYSAGVYIVATICFIVFLFDMSGIIKLNAFLAPIMIIGCVFMGLYTYATKSQNVFIQASSLAGFMKRNWYLAAITYASYNIITAVTVLSSMKGRLKDSKETLKAGIWAGIILGILGLCIAVALNSNYDAIAGYEIPMLQLAINNGPVIEYMYILIFVLAIFTTAATNGFAVIEWLSGRYGLNKFVLKFVVSFLGIIAAYMGFSNLVANIYPLFAIAGIAEIVLIARYLAVRKPKRAKHI